MKSVCFTHSIMNEHNEMVHFSGLEFKADISFEDFKSIVKILQTTHNFDDETIVAQMDYYSNSKYDMISFDETEGNASQANMWYDVAEIVLTGSKHYTNTIVCNGKYETITYTMSANEENYYINTSVGNDISENKELTVIDINENYAEEDYNALFDYAVNNFGDVNDQDLENFVGNQLEQIKSMDLGLSQGGDDLEV